MGGRSYARRALAILAVAVFAWSLAAPARAQVQLAVEYYYADWNFYFVTAFPDEIAALDGGAFGGAWKRTGQTFYVWTGPTGGALPTCRFFSVVFDPKSSHFYTPYADECASLKAGNAWQFEAIAFYLLLPDANGQCPAGTVVLFRLYNNGMGGAPNHRFITDVATFHQMQTVGWSFEGNGLTGAFACVPSGPAIPSAAQGFWDGTTNASESLEGIVLDDGSFFFFYAAADNSSAGLLQGLSSAENGQFSTSNAKDFRFFTPSQAVGDASIAGSYVPRMSLDGGVTSLFGSRMFAASYDNSFEQPADLSLAAGTYSGQSLSTRTFQITAITLSSTGAVSGSAGLCSVVGTAMPHGSVNVVDISLTFGGASCALSGVFTGVLIYDAASGQSIVIAVNADRSDALLFLGSK